MSSDLSFNLQGGNSVYAKTLMVGMLANGVGKKYKTKWSRYELTCHRPRTHAENLLNVGAKRRRKILTSDLK